MRACLAGYKLPCACTHAERSAEACRFYIDADYDYDEDYDDVVKNDFPSAVLCVTSDVITKAQS